MNELRWVVYRETRESNASVPMCACISKEKAAVVAECIQSYVVANYTNPGWYAVIEWTWENTGEWLAKTG